MEILLKRNIESLGRIGDVITVREGYARNHLLPMGYGVSVTKENLQQIEKERARALAEEATRTEGLKGLATQIEGASITIEERANDQGHLFGSVAAAQIVAALAEKGISIEERQVRLENPIKEIGVFEVGIHLHQDLNAKVKVWVVQSKPE
jgi:large subunit ribosomal protein L9